MIRALPKCRHASHLHKTVVAAWTTSIGARRIHAATVGAAAQHLRQSLDARVVGHPDAKEALVLALLAREHVLLAGPPGVAKSMLAEELAKAAGVHPMVLQLHRDTRAEELLSRGGILRREPLASGQGETVRYQAEPGGVLASDVCVLDDVTRAPGEVLSSLFRALSQPMPLARAAVPSPCLRTAVATAISIDDRGAAWPACAQTSDQLDPALLDRFAFQLQLGSNLCEERWDEAEKIMSAGEGTAGTQGSALAGALGEGLADCIAVPLEVRQLLLRLVQQLVLECRRASPAGSERSGVPHTLSDRTFLVKAVRVLRASALSAGRDCCEPEDLFALRFLTTFRVPPDVHARIEDIIRGILEAAQEAASRGDPDWATGTTKNGEAADDQALRPWHEGEESAAGEEQNSESGGGADTETGSAGEKDAAMAAKQKQDQSEEQSGQSDDIAQNQDDGSQDDSEHKGLMGSGPRITSPSKNSGDDDLVSDGLQPPRDALAANMGLLDVDAVSVQNIELLLDRLVGSIDRGRSELAENPGGSPRRWRSWDPRDAADFTEVDPLELHRWVGDPSPAAWPRARQRLKRDRGGLVAVLRDVSMSMSGLNATWAARVTLGLMEASRERNMRFGYIEFNHSSQKFRGADGEFFSEEYASMSELAMRLKCSGWTNYSKPLGDALKEFALIFPGSSAYRRVGLGGVSRGGQQPQQQQRHVLLITDGVPTHGDAEASAERALALELGVVVHSVYLGWPQSYPSALAALSSTTGGTQFAAFYQPDRGMGRLTSGHDKPHTPRVRGSHGVGLDSGFIRVVVR
eukprot:TRINITY_DN18991_c0_g1_i1.p1 TRINITY_DN18991_c0_g1~~TRINITY_DN18991_c0_g1_i1.p1  ORF type:complete len:806 (+),score=182.84 TRINITY_DN18991_c0_g1_i1:57-2474(+)